MLAVSESSSLQELWRTAMEHLADEHAELITVYVRDDRWRRAASLPFTEEVSRASGGSMNFTPQRAEEVDRDAAVRTRGQLQQLATESKVQLAFEIIAEHEATRIHEFVRSEADLLIAPSFFEGQPFHSEMVRLKCRILLVDSDDVTTEPEDN